MKNWQTNIHPALAELVVKLCVNLGVLGYDVRVVQALRSFEEQDALYAKGRTAPGGRVTNAVGGQSNHNYGLAVDLCPFVKDQPDWNFTEAFLAVGREAKKIGLEWGGDWKLLKLSLN